MSVSFHKAFLIGQPLAVHGRMGRSLFCGVLGRAHQSSSGRVLDCLRNRKETEIAVGCLARVCGTGQKWKKGSSERGHRREPTRVVVKTQSAEDDTHLAVSVSAHLSSPPWAGVALSCPSEVGLGSPYLFESSS